MERPTERFTTRADNYARYRPGYPPAAVTLLQQRCGLAPGAAVADLGSGTGILSALLLASGAEVFAVEPNEAMRAEAERALQGWPRFHSVHGSAEDTTLAPASIDLVVAAQAFHWFEPGRARTESLRITRGQAWGALLWNERPQQGSPFLLDYEALLRRHAAEYARITASRADEPRMRAYLGGNMERASFPNRQSVNFEGLAGRVMSASYAPEPGHPHYEPMMRELRQVFERHAQRGQVVLAYETLVYFGPLRP